MSRSALTIPAFPESHKFQSCEMRKQMPSGSFFYLNESIEKNVLLGRNYGSCGPLLLNDSLLTKFNYGPSPFFIKKKKGKFLTENVMDSFGHWGENRECEAPLNEMGVVLQFHSTKYGTRAAALCKRHFLLPGGGWVSLKCFTIVCSLYLFSWEIYWL